MKQLATVTEGTVRELMEKMQGEFSAAFPAVMPVDRFIRVALTDFKDNPKLMGCDSKSFLGCLMMCAQLGLEPGKTLGHAYILPFYNKNSGKTEATFILGYRGMIELMMRTGKVSSIMAHEVYSKDLFEYEFGLNEKLVHKPADGDRGVFTHVYCVIRFIGGGYAMHVMSKYEIDKAKSYSKAGNFGPWITHYDDMSKKTVLRRLFKFVQVALQASVTIQRGVIADEAADRGEQKDYLPNGFDDVLGEEEQEHIKSITEQVKEII